MTKAKVIGYLENLFVVVLVVGGGYFALSGMSSSEEKAKPVASKSQPAKKAKPKQYTESDFYWDDKTRPHKEAIIAGVNKLARENAKCKIIDPSSAYISIHKGTPANPVFYVPCGQGATMFNAFFSRSEAMSSSQLTAKANISKGAAITACRERAKQLANHPSTVDFSVLMDAAYTAHGGGRTTLISTFTAKNSFNLEQKFKIRCLFDGGNMLESTVNEI